MALLFGLLRPLQLINGLFGRVSRWAAVIALGLMVLVILAQVFYRYALNNALPWPEEAARFGMLWMTGLMAPVAYRQGGFVAIDMAERALPPRASALLVLLLTTIALVVLAYALPLGAKHVQSGCLFKSATLWLPFTLEFALPLPGTGLDLTLCTRNAPAFGFTAGWVKMPLAVMYASLYLGMQLLLLVNLELMLRAVIVLLGGDARLPDLSDPNAARAD